MNNCEMFLIKLLCLNDSVHWATRRHPAVKPEYVGG